MAQRYPSRNQVHVHVLNTRSKARRTGWELLWGDNGDWSKEKRTPVTDKWKPTFKPWIEVVEFENLVPAVVTVTGGDPSGGRPGARGPGRGPTVVWAQPGAGWLDLFPPARGEISATARQPIGLGFWRE